MTSPFILYVWYIILMVSIDWTTLAFQEHIHLVIVDNLNVLLNSVC